MVSFIYSIYNWVVQFLNLTSYGLCWDFNETTDLKSFIFSFESPQEGFCLIEKNKSLQWHVMTTVPVGTFIFFVIVTCLPNYIK